MNKKIFLILFLVITTMLFFGCVGEEGNSTKKELLDCGVISASTTDAELKQSELCVKEVFSTCNGKFVMVDESVTGIDSIEVRAEEIGGANSDECSLRFFLKIDGEIKAVADCNFLKSKLKLVVDKDSFDFEEIMGSTSEEFCEMITDPDEIKKIYDSSPSTNSQTNSTPFNDSPPQVVGELVPGQMSKEEIKIFFDGLGVTSHIISNDYYSPESNALIMKSTIYSQFGSTESKMRISSTMFMGGGISNNSDTYMSYENDSKGNLTELISYKTCMDNPMGGQKICMDLKQMGGDISELLKEQNLSNDKDLADSVISYLGEKNIIGVKSKCFKMIYSESSTAINCYHPNYLILLETKVEDESGALVRATNLKIGDVDSKEFEEN